MPEAAIRPLKLGIFLPTFEGSGDGLFAHTMRWPELLTFARRVEATGFDSVWVPDHLLLRWEGDQGPSQGIWEAWSILSALAATTERIELGTLVLCSAFRNPALLAKMADTVDEISGGRLILGLGAGYHEPEFRAFGYPYEYLGARFEEALTIIATLLRQGKIDFEGRFYQARDCELRPSGPLGRRSSWPVARRLARACCAWRPNGPTCGTIGSCSAAANPTPFNYTASGWTWPARRRAVIGPRWAGRSPSWSPRRATSQRIWGRRWSR